MRPTKVPQLRNIVAVAAGYWHSLALDSDGRVWSAGHHKNGELGREGQGDTFAPVNAPEGVTFAKISAGFGVSFLIDTQGELYTCGNAKLNLHGAVKNVPTKVKKITEPVRLVAASQVSVQLVTESGKLFAWGDNVCQQSGTGSKKDFLPNPTEVTWFSQ